MKPYLLLVDLQQDYLKSPNLYPSASSVIRRAQQLVQGCRRLAVPVLHGWTTVNRKNDQRMNHWKKTGKWMCVEGTDGHKPPNSLAPQDQEVVVHKTGYSLFRNQALDTELRAAGCDILIIAGVQLHACVRSAVLDAYERGYAVIVADDAVASDDPLHAAITRRYLGDRGIQFLPVASILDSLTQQPRTMAASSSVYVHRSPRDTRRVVFEITEAQAGQIREKAVRATRAFDRWRQTDLKERRHVLSETARLLDQQSRPIVDMLIEHIGKPRAEAQAEVDRTVQLLRICAEYGEESTGRATSAYSRYRYEPLGAVGLITPWNNPVAVPLGKIAPALLYGNAVVWKPAPAATKITDQIKRILLEADCDEDLVGVLHGQGATARRLAAGPNISAVSVTGSIDAGLALAEICTRRHIPMQGEFGGNNGVIVWGDADNADAANAIAPAAFGFAGQRCTANRRVIVDENCVDELTQCLVEATRQLIWGDPDKVATQVGPVISNAKKDELSEWVTVARDTSLEVWTPHQNEELSFPSNSGAYFPPTIIRCDDPADLIVQRESFGPVLVIQAARDFEHALDLLNGVPHGLAASLYSDSAHLRQTFMNEARAGILKINQPTTGADAGSPFGGWKASGLGPPEHGPSDREFYTRTQTIYDHGLSGSN